MSIKIPAISTTAGASATGAALVNLILGLLNGWHWWAAESTQVQTSAEVLLSGIGAYLAAWLKVVMTPGQKTSMELTGGPLPTMQAVPPVPGTSGRFTQPPS
jgi:hypothetical protein